MVVRGWTVEKHRDLDIWFFRRWYKDALVRIAMTDREIRSLGSKERVAQALAEKAARQLAGV
jgi:hypothetical protein